MRLVTPAFHCCLFFSSHLKAPQLRCQLAHPWQRHTPFLLLPKSPQGDMLS